MTALSIQHLTKVYENGKTALDNISLEVQEGDFFALLGPNGAGKSTTIGIVTSLVNKTKGYVSVFGYDIDKKTAEAKACIGIVPQEFNFSIFEKVLEIILCQAGYYGVPRKEAYARAEFYLQKLGLWEYRFQQARMLSGGLKRRLMITRALIHSPKLLILDEPTAGVDIELRRSLWKFLQDLNREGVTIILTTHYLEEAENLCRNIAIIDKGRIIENSNMRALLNTLDTETFILYLREPINELPSISEFPLRKIDNTTLEVDLRHDQNLSDVFVFLAQKNIAIVSMRNKANRLEELFIRLVGES